MAFAEKVVTRALLRARWMCECCGVPIRKRSLCEVHSATTLHLDIHPERPDRYVVTSPPPNHKIMKGKTLPVSGFRVYALGHDDDGFVFCPTCHDNLHALIDPPTDGGRNAKPEELEEKTIRFVATRGKMTF